MVVCPSCESTNIRNDYKPAPLILRMLGIRALLCDHCNRQFKAFCPVSPKRTSKSGKPSRDRISTGGSAEIGPLAPRVDLGQLRRNVAEAQAQQADSLRRVQLSLKPSESGEVVAGQEIPIQHDLKTQVLKLHAQSAKEAPRKQAAQAHSNSTLECSECGSRNVKQRHRSAIERAALALTDHKAFNCRDCGASFYAKQDDKDRGVNIADAGMLPGLSPDGKG